MRADQVRSPLPVGHDVRVEPGIAYDTAGELTSIGSELLPLLADLPVDAVEICRVVQSLLLSPDGATALKLPEARHAEREIRDASQILATLVALEPAPVIVRRAPEDRVVGTCRHFAVLGCALLRYRGIAARARCGFAGYFVPGKYVDHWIVEVRDLATHRWIRIDVEWLGVPIVGNPENLAPGEFLTGGEAWTLCRAGGADPVNFGVHGVDHAWGIGEIRGNAIRDLAALNKVEMLPWDEWGRMDASYKGETGPEYDALIDTAAATCASDDPMALRSLYASEDLSVPQPLIR